ncbi:transcription antiterminator [Eubacterium sp. AF19-17]|nr:transcription antiterminator [Eubacterium sp. AF19-17]
MILLNERLKGIIRILKDTQDYITSKQLADQMDISVRTIKSTLKGLKMELTAYGAELEIKRGVGYRLHILNEEAFLPIKNRIQSESPRQFPHTQKERSIYIIRKLLSLDYPIKLDDLADELYVSRNTISLDIKEVKRLLHNYHLIIVQSNNNGIIVEGSEIQKRICINDFFFQDKMQDFFVQNNVMFSSEYNQNEIRYIREALLHVLNKHNIHFSDVSIQNMVIHIVIELRRCKFYQYVRFDDAVMQQMKEHKAYKAAIELKQMLEEQMNIILPEHETIYLTMHILSKTVMGNEDIRKFDLSYMDALLQKVFKRIEQRFAISFKKDTEIYEFLKLHIPSMAERIRLQLTLRNPLLLENNRRYQFAVELTLEAVDVIEEELQIEIDHNEFGYLVLYFNLALNRYQSRIKKRLILVSGYGRPEMIMTLNTLNENFKGFIDDIVTCDVIELENFSFQHNDIVITTIPIMPSSKVPVVYIQGKVEFYYHEILSLLKSEYDINCSIRKYLLPSLYQEGLLCKNKQDVYKELEKLLAAMWGEAEAAKLVNGIYHLGNEVGNDIICLHSRYDYHTPFIAFLSLKNHMLWEKQHVRYIFFMNMNVESDKEMVHHMYHLISNWADVKTRITYYAKNQDYQELIESLDKSRL